MPARARELGPGDPVPGTKYRIVRQLGAGGMGVVYQVVKPPEIQGVLKLMAAELAAIEEFRRRFLDEVRVLAQLNHPNIVKVFDYDTLDDGTPFYVMELLHGRTVRDVVATVGAVAPRVAFEVTRQLLEALHCAHTHEIPVVHRDIKPENIFLHAPKHGDPVVKLIDFGVVAIADRAHDGMFVGTWRYAAPEQIRGERATPATDLYAVGLVLYELLCGAGPFDHIDTGQLISQAHLRETPRPISTFAPWVPASIVELISSALAKDPRRRPRDAYEFAERLYELQWADDGLAERTGEGPIERIRATGPTPAPIRAPAPPRRRATLQGVGEAVEPPEPDDESLLAGLLARHASDVARGASPGPPPAIVARGASPGPPAIVASPRPPTAVTIDAPSTGANERARGAGRGGAGATQAETDTFASQQSDAGPAPRTRVGLLLIPILCGLAVAAAIAVVLVRARGAPRGASSEPPAQMVAPPAPLPAPTTSLPAPPSASESPGAAAPPRPDEHRHEARPSHLDHATRGSHHAAPPETAPAHTAPPPTAAPPSGGSSGYIQTF